MMLKQIIEGYKNTYSVGDRVNTSLGNGELVKTVSLEFVMFHPDKSSQEHYDLEDRPYRIGYTEIHKHI